MTGRSLLARRYSPRACMTGCAALLALCWAGEASAQGGASEAPYAAPVQSQDMQGTAEQAARTADSAVGRAGQRQQTRGQAPGIEPMARIDSRISNRVRTRLRTRIDRNYDPTANAASPFADADDKARRPNAPH